MPATPPQGTEHTLALGEILSSRYRIERFIARGGMGEVYDAHDLDLRAEVALKTIGADFARQPKALDRFKREVLLARNVSHPNVCRCYDLGRDQERNAPPSADQGAYSDPRGAQFYRPMAVCKMRWLSEPFCRVCDQAQADVIKRAIHQGQAK